MLNLRALIFSFAIVFLLTETTKAQSSVKFNLGLLPELGNKSESFFGNSNLSYKIGFLRETEELYSNSNIYQTIGWGKNFTDIFRFDFYSQIEYSERVEVDVPDRERWFDNFKVVARLDPNDYNHLDAFGSASISDTTITSYGGLYRATVELGDVLIKNTITGGYDYFYYWNMVGQDYVSESVDLSYSGFNLALSYFYGNVRENYIDGYDIKGRNPNNMVNFGLSYDVLNSPKVNVGVYYQMRNYDFYSPLYYSPQDRKISGIGSYFFDTFGKFYTYFGAGAKLDNNDTFVWSLDAEGGYEYDGFSASAGIGKYDDPYYENLNVFLNFTKKF